jgi:hypothetical protein
VIKGLLHLQDLRVLKVQKEIKVSRDQLVILLKGLKDLKEAHLRVIQVVVETKDLKET